MAHRVCVMTQGRIVEHGRAETVFTAPRHEYTRHLLAAEPSGDPVPATRNAPPVMAASGLSVEFNLARGWFSRAARILKAVDQVDVAVRRGQTLGIVGESGSGKTTLAMALLRLLSSSGDIHLDGQPIPGPWAPNP